MISQKFMEFYYWGSYLWFAAVFVVIAIPAVIQIKKLFSINDK